MDEVAIMNYLKVYYFASLAPNPDEWVNAMNSLINNPIQAPLYLPLHTNYKNKDYKKLPFHLEAAAYYSVNEGHLTSRKYLANYELMLTKKGQAVLIYNDEKYTLMPNSSMVIDCRKPHIYKVEEGHIWEYKHLHFSTNSQQILVEKAMGYNSDYGSSELIFDDIIKYSRNENELSPYIYSNCINNILTQLVINREITMRKNLIDNELPDEIADYLRAHFAEDISLDKLFLQFHFSPHYLIKIFRKKYNDTPYSFLNKYRIYRAKLMIADGASVEETAVDCGFKSSNNFYRAVNRAKSNLNSTLENNGKNQGEMK